MWTGWNSSKRKERLLQKTFGYVKPTTFPPTHDDVVLETLKHSTQLQLSVEQ